MKCKEQAFSRYFATFRTPKAAFRQGHKRRDTGTAETWSMLEHHQTCWSRLYLRDLHRHSIPLRFDLSHSRAGISSMFDRAPKSITGLCYPNTDALLIQHTRPKTITVIHMFLTPQLQVTLTSVFTIFLENLPLFSHTYRPILRELVSCSL